MIVNVKKIIIVLQIIMIKDKNQNRLIVIIIDQNRRIMITTHDHTIIIIIITINMVKIMIVNLLYRKETIIDIVIDQDHEKEENGTDNLGKRNDFIVEKDVFIVVILDIGQEIALIMMEEIVVFIAVNPDIWHDYVPINKEENKDIAVKDTTILQVTAEKQIREDEVHQMNDIHKIVVIDIIQDQDHHEAIQEIDIKIQDNI
jgi:hypothetical protein